MTAESVEFDRYSVVLHASAEVARKVFSYREAIGMPDLTSEPHVALVGLRATIDVGAVKRVLRTIASRHSPIQVVCEPQPFRQSEQSPANSWGGLAVLPSTELTQLQRDLESELESRLGTPMRVRDIRPHLTLHQSAAEDEAARGVELGQRLNIGTGFEATSIDLVGLAGPPRGGIRRIMGRFPLGE